MVTVMMMRDAATLMMMMMMMLLVTMAHGFLLGSSSTAPTTTTPRQQQQQPQATLLHQSNNNIKNYYANLPLSCKSLQQSCSNNQVTRLYSAKEEGCQEKEEAMDDMMDLCLAWEQDFGIVKSLEDVLDEAIVVFGDCVRRRQTNGSALHRQQQQQLQTLIQDMTYALHSLKPHHCSVVRNQEAAFARW